ncbi:ImmA/IrrE family metallo-endopeptidase [Mucilaginibacter gilvus]|uniref:ImmA/IrrE family metallo-endopeptidase n=1 Tax=Mucilaginibacter gilvus TaxID=2305909 RepID=A0A3S3ULR3_9SPHI|nr:ImmA/IrrE family metallo-endopeptidase [Mucilaginibacter gilvus]RWY49358.1 ImmA/IrrE family metallo-endopeptidase [Mucilaginibacter gilvus]
MAISFVRTRKIEELALGLIESAGFKKTPIDIKKIASSLGVSVMPYDFGNEMSGVLVLNNDVGTIGYNKDHSEQRSRFTIAHELGHYILHRKNHNDVFVDKDFIVMYRRRNDRNYTQIELIQEQEANAFAAAILMPEHLIECEVRNNNFYSELSELQLIDKLAKTFRVSSPAMTFRLHNLSILS